MKTKIVICILFLMFSAFAGSVFGGTEGPSDTYYGTNAGNGNADLSNTFMGVNAGHVNTANDNTFIGGEAGPVNTAGHDNTFTGYRAGYSNIGGAYNTFVGARAGYTNTDGSSNTFLGYEAGICTDGSSNIFIGFQAGYNNTDGSSNTFLGSGAGFRNNSGSGNVFLGNAAGENETGSNKLYIAHSSTATPLIYGDFANQIVGINGSLGVGTQSPVRALHLSGPNAVVRMDRTINTAAFIMVRTDGSGNPLKTFVVGTNASASGNGTFVINDLGTAVVGPGNNVMTINNDDSVTFTGPVTAQTYYSSSSLTLKDNVRTYENALDTVNRLRGVSFDWKDSGKPSVGLIAEEVEKVVPEVVAYNDGAATGVNYASLVGVLVEAVKEHKKITEQQQGLIQEQQNAILTLQKELNELKERIR